MKEKKAGTEKQTSIKRYRGQRVILVASSDLTGEQLKTVMDEFGEKTDILVHFTKNVGCALGDIRCWRNYLKGIVKLQKGDVVIIPPGMGIFPQTKALVKPLLPRRFQQLKDVVVGGVPLFVAM